MTSGLIRALAMLGLGAMAAGGAGASDGSVLTAAAYDQLGSLAQDRLDCSLATPSREGPEPCGLQSIEACGNGGDVACLWQHYQAWHEVLAALTDRRPADWFARLEATEGVPTYFLVPRERTAQEQMEALEERCPGAEIGADRIESCIFDAANSARGWRDVLVWLSGRDPRRPLHGD